MPELISVHNNTTEEFDSDLNTLASFINLRQMQKQQIMQNKNSLSKVKLNPKENNKENIENLSTNQTLFSLVKLLNEQLNEGHTILNLYNIEQNQRDIFLQWQQQGWLTILNNDNAKQKIITPLILQMIYRDNNQVDAVIWLHRQWFAENQLSKQLLQLAKQPLTKVNLSKKQDRGINKTNEKTQKKIETVDSIQPNEKQRLAIHNAKQFALSIITGGPGTGKTFTVARLVTELQHEHHQKKLKQPHTPPLSIALTAPTGKAAQRMQESLQKSLAGEKIELDDAKTLHRLLGINQYGMPRYHAHNPLPYDLIIVDEASMLGLELASLLVDAIKPSARLILLGDANQLAAVDAGSVLSDICQVPQLQPYRTELTESKRFDKDSIIGQFANILNSDYNFHSNDHSLDKFKKNKLKQIQELLTVADFSARTDDKKLNFYPVQADTVFKQVYTKLSQGYESFFKLIQNWYVDVPNIQQDSIRKQLFSTFDSYRILTAGHQGQLGSETLNKKISEQFFKFTKLPPSSDFFYHGLPIMITSNDYQLGLFNGDIGICLAIENTMWVCFPDKLIASSRLSRDSCEPAYAMTIHKSQGSEFDKVAVCLDRVHMRLLSQELVYTAVTRSKGKLLIVSQPNILNHAVLQKGNRQTGLALQFQ